MALTDILTALADDTSRRILTILRAGSHSAGELAQALDMPPSKLSYHLTKLKKAELIYETRWKNFLIYDLNLTVLDEAILWLRTLKGESK